MQGDVRGEQASERVKLLEFRIRSLDFVLTAMKTHGWGGKLSRGVT